MATDPTISLKIRTALGEYLKRDPATIRSPTICATT